MPTYETTEDQADELILFADNDERLYNQMYVYILRALLRRKKNGSYNHTLAVKAFENFANATAQKYVRELPGNEVWYREFPPAARKRAAREWTERFEQQFRAGDLAWVEKRKL